MADDSRLSWPHTAPPPLRTATLRATPDDFAVEEELPWQPEGHGEHLWVQLRKRGLNTDRAAQCLARAAGVPRRAVSYAGLKDRHAVTVQWFSLHLPGRPDPVFDSLPPALTVLTARRHTRKLKTGALTGNRFAIVLRDVAGDRDALVSRLDTVRRQGVPNYFGEQRFGHDAGASRDGGGTTSGTKEVARRQEQPPRATSGTKAGNIEHARRMFAGEPVRDRHLRGLYLSAARSRIFNAILAARVRAGTWNTLLPGEACVLAGSHSFFVIDAPDATLMERLARHDIHPSGALWGAGELPTRHALRTLEEAIAAQHADLAQGLAAADLRHERRALRLVPQKVTVEWDGSVLSLAFSLPAGSYATTVLRELAHYRDAAADSRA
jgi:tRNA pseudouridine13 synthase